MIFSPSSTIVLFICVFASIGTSKPIPPSIPSEEVDKVSVHSSKSGYPPSPPSPPPPLYSLSITPIYTNLSLTHSYHGGGKQGQIQCNIPRAGYQNYARSKRIKEGEDYLFRRGGHFLARPLMTEVVSCSWNAAISVMNTVSFFCFFLPHPPSRIIPTLLFSSSSFITKEFLGCIWCEKKAKKN